MKLRSAPIARSARASMFGAALACTFAAFAAGPVHAEDEFADWVSAFRTEAVSAGVSPATYDFAFSGVSINERVKAANERQPEFTKPVWEYLEGALSPLRIEKGSKKIVEQSALFDDIEERYGVNRALLTAVWGLESNFGDIMGDYNVIEALATLGFEGRRTSYGRSQLIGALKILDRGYATKFQLKGSWAGAMGQTQFIPTTYLDYAVDHDGDGVRDLWGNHGDVFASTANYLSRSGWTFDAPAAKEVQLPADFDYAFVDLKTRKSVTDWGALGVLDADGAPLAANDANAALLAPAGAGGPKFLVYDNFRSIMRYNNSTSYALAITMLSAEFAGAPIELKSDWPTHERMLTRAERIELQKQLARLGYPVGAADGVIGAKTRAALRTYQSTLGVPPDGFATATLLEKLKES